jgi:hypothetical protein
VIVGILLGRLSGKDQDIGNVAETIAACFTVTELERPMFRNPPPKDLG